MQVTALSSSQGHTTMLLSASHLAGLVIPFNKQLEGNWKQLEGTGYTSHLLCLLSFSVSTWWPSAPPLS